MVFASPFYRLLRFLYIRVRVFIMGLDPVQGLGSTHRSGSTSGLTICIYKFLFLNGCFRIMDNIGYDVDLTVI